MSVLKKSELMDKLKTIIGEKTDDETLAFIEDVNDTFDDKNKGGTSDEEWQKKLDENDKMWREKYRDRFFKSSGTDEDVNKNIDDVVKKGETEVEKPLTFENLFKNEEG